VRSNGLIKLIAVTPDAGTTRIMHMAGATIA
jgi:hypothetical protein